MSVPSRPHTNVHEGPAGSCVINGRDLSWTNCTPAGFADALDKATLGKHRITACGVRHLTGDTSGGTTLAQNAEALRREYGIEIEVRVGPNVAAPSYVAGQLRAGRGFNGQGNTGALLGTTWRSTRGYVNHNVYFNEGRDWHKTDSGVWLPREVLAYDPAADNRAASWGRADNGPSWWTWGTALRFFSYLRPWGDDDPRTLGAGKVYAALFPDTEPHVHLHFTGSRRSTPFPESKTAKAAAGHKVNVRTGPSTKYPIVEHLSIGERFAAYQENPQGQSLAGSRLWIGGHNGNRWVHSSGLR